MMVLLSHDSVMTAISISFNCMTQYNSSVFLGIDRTFVLSSLGKDQQYKCTLVTLLGTCPLQLSCASQMGLVWTLTGILRGVTSCKVNFSDGRHIFRRNRDFLTARYIIIYVKSMHVYIDFMYDEMSEII